VRSLAADGHDVIVLSRAPGLMTGLPGGVRAERWDGRTAEGWAALADGADAIVFTAGVGENSAATRAATLVGLEEFGILMDGGLNQTAGGQARVISAAGSQVAVLVVPTDEELEIARQSIEVVRR